MLSPIKSNNAPAGLKKALEGSVAILANVSSMTTKSIIHTINQRRLKPIFFKSFLTYCHKKKRVLSLYVRSTVNQQNFTL